MFKIEINTDRHGWIDDPSFFGHLLRWYSEEDALDFCNELVSYSGFDRSKLRVVLVPADGRF